MLSLLGEKEFGRIEFPTGFTGLTGCEAEGLNRQYVFATGKHIAKLLFARTYGSAPALFDTRRSGLLHYFQMVNEP